jgi:hypothetical protein
VHPFQDDADLLADPTAADHPSAARQRSGACGDLRLTVRLALELSEVTRLSS